MVIDFHVHTAYYRNSTPAYLDLLLKGWGERLEWMIETYSSPEAFLGLMDEAGIDYAVILAEMCYLGWQESLDQLAKLVEPEIPG